LLLAACSAKPKQDNLPAVVVPDTVTLVDLGSLHCKPCLMMMPVLDALTKKYKGRAVVKFIDVNKYPAIARQFKVMTIPTQVLFDRQGREVMRHVGFIPQADLEKELDKVL
jgi:thioredoxin 1